MGTDPLRNSEEIWDELYTRTAMNGRRGMVIHAMGNYFHYTTILLSSSLVF